MRVPDTAVCSAKRRAACGNPSHPASILLLALLITTAAAPCSAQQGSNSSSLAEALKPPIITFPAANPVVQPPPQPLPQGVATSSTTTAGAPSGSASAMQCPITVAYSVNLGQGKDTAQVPFFAATITVTNNDPNTTVNSWRMGWQFPFGSTIKNSVDVLDPGLELLVLNSNTPIVETATGTASMRNDSLAIAPGNSVQFLFIGTKGNESLSSTNPYNVGAIDGVAFNNLLCSRLTAPVSGQQQKLAAPNALPGTAISNPTQVEVEYTPIEYQGQSLVNTYTQFLVRIRNIRNSTSISLADVGLQYWFRGPDVPLYGPVESAPWDYFEGRCEWATTGCDGVTLGISSGYLDGDDARFALNVTFNGAAGMLLPSGDNSVPALFLGSGVDVLDVLLTVTTKEGTALTGSALNSTQDYSFMDTPVLPQAINLTTTATNATNASSLRIIPRRALPNQKIPAYLAGELVWGVLPNFDRNGNSPAQEAARNGIINQTGSGGSGGILPEDVVCEEVRQGAQQSCTLLADYCCAVPDATGPQGVSATVPLDWPPKALSSTQGSNATGTQPPTAEGAPSGEVIVLPTVPQPVIFPPIPSPPPPPPVETTSGQPTGSSGGGGGSWAWVAGVAVGISVVAILAGGGLFVWRRRRRRIQEEADAMRKAGTAGSDSQNFVSLGGGTPGQPPSGKKGPAFPTAASYSFRPSPSLNSVTVSANGTPWAAPLHDHFSEQSSNHQSPHSSPSIAASYTAHLLAGASSSTYHRTSSNGVNPLHKFPSGMSGVSGVSQSGTDPSAVLDTFSSDGGTRTLPFSPFMNGGEEISAASAAGNHVDAHGVLGGQGFSLRTDMATALHSNGDNSNGGGEGGGGGGGLPPNVLQLLEKKCRTCPAVFGSTPVPSKNAKRENRGIKGQSLSQDLDEGSPIESDDNDGRGYFYAIESPSMVAGASAAWQVRRSASWDGVLHDAHALDNWSDFMCLKRRKTAQRLEAPLPPLSPLPPPLLPGSSTAAPHVDMDVDWAELEGHLGRCLGTGGFGAVYEAAWRGRQVAVKMLPSFATAGGAGGGSGGSQENNPNGENPHDGSGGGQAAYDALIREIQLASKFDCERLVRVHGACTSDRARCCLIMELAPGGNLFQRIYDRNKRRLTYMEILQLAHDVAEGLAYLHPSVVHRDLKPQNILMDCEGRAKIADFGISRVKDPTKSYITQVTNDAGTPFYMAPELFNGTRVDEKVDVYALGCILNEVYTRRQPWRNSSHFFQIILKVAINGERPWMDPDCPEPLKRLITKCWHQDPHQRPSCADVMRLTELMMQEEVRRWEQLSPAASLDVRSGR